MPSELHGELDRFRVAYAHHLERDVEPISLAAVEEGLGFFEAVEKARQEARDGEVTTIDEILRGEER